ncbi:MAG: hypothetical protein ABSH16_11790 [Sedimentisphaerales bacterium]
MAVSATRSEVKGLLLKSASKTFAFLRLALRSPQRFDSISNQQGVFSAVKNLLRFGLV